MLVIYISSFGGTRFPGLLCAREGLSALRNQRPAEENSGDKQTEFPSGKPKKEPAASRKANGKPKMGSNGPSKSCSRTCRADLAVSGRLPSFAGYFPLAPTGPAKQLKKQPLNPTCHEFSDHPLAFLQRSAASDFRCHFSCKSRLDPLDAVDLHPALDCNHFTNFEPDKKTVIPPTPSVARGGTSRR